MPRYRKKPVVIEAVQLTSPIEIETLEGKMRGEVGDWLITGVKGEQYPCKDEIFRVTYEPVGDERVEDELSEHTEDGAAYFCLRCRTFVPPSAVDPSVFPVLHRECGGEAAANVSAGLGEAAMRAGES